MPDENELEELTNKFLEDTMAVGGVFHGNEAESTEKLGAVVEHCGADCVPRKNVLQD